MLVDAKELISFLNAQKKSANETEKYVLEKVLGYVASHSYEPNLIEKQTTNFTITNIQKPRRVDYRDDILEITFDLNNLKAEASLEIHEDETILVQVSGENFFYCIYDEDEEIREIEKILKKNWCYLNEQK